MSERYDDKRGNATNSNNNVHEAVQEIVELSEKVLSQEFINNMLYFCYISV